MIYNYIQQYNNTIKTNILICIQTYNNHLVCISESRKIEKCLCFVITLIIEFHIFRIIVKLFSECMSICKR